jgi:hypothetical protein
VPAVRTARGTDAQSIVGRGKRLLRREALSLPQLTDSKTFSRGGVERSDQLAAGTV